MTLNIKGLKSGMLTAVSPTTKRTYNKNILWICKCKCGQHSLSTATQIKRKTKKSCGCNNVYPRRGSFKRGKDNPQFIDLTGKKYGWLTVLKRIGSNKKRNVVWLCICRCGNYHKASTLKLNEGVIRSCGCLRYAARFVQDTNIEGIDITKEMVACIKIRAKIKTMS